MEAALAELGLEDLTKEAEDDKDFFVERGESPSPGRNSTWHGADDYTNAYVDEEDIFGSDFESTDEETAQAEVDAGDKALDEEEKRAQKVRPLSFMGISFRLTVVTFFRQPKQG
jgi:vacuolar protein sorting-associated protein 72